MSARTLVFLLLFAGPWRLFAQTNDSPPADAWVTNAVTYPPPAPGRLVRSNAFATLRAEAMLERHILVSWQPAPLDTNAIVSLGLSVDHPGHWPVRDWHESPMTVSGSAWTLRVPVDSIHVPLVYFVRAVMPAATNVSPMRVCYPDLARLAAPSRPFWPFLEGFEEGLESWTILASPSEPATLATDPIARSGRRSLKVTLPARKRSVTVATTRVRGWQLHEKEATGIALWLRTKGGEGLARFTLQANAFTTNQTSAVHPQEARVNNQWRKVSLPLDAFPKLTLPDVDWFAIEFVGLGPVDFLIDDLELLGPWKDEQ